MNQPSYFEIQSIDVARAASFYRHVFGWTIDKDPAIPIEYWRIETAGIRGAILQRPVPAPPGAAGTNAFVVSMEVGNFDETAARVLRSGGRVAMDKFAVPGKCWQGYFIDIDGNTFGIFEVDTSAA